MNWTAWLSACTVNCEHWNNHIYRARDNFDSFSSQKQNSKFPYDTFEPVWNCRSKERIPALGGDGPKFVCGLSTTYDQSSMQYILSLGSNGDSQFEDSIHKKLPKATIITADPTLSDEKLNNIKHKKHIEFLNVGIGSEDSMLIGKKRYKSMSMQRLLSRYRKIDILKIDIEGSEREIFKPNMACATLKNVDQVLIEIHGDRVNSVFEWFYNCNMLIFSKEPNIWGCMGVHCVEYSFISPNFAHKEYIASR